MRKVELNVELDIPIKTYPSTANTMAILLTDKQNFSWFASQYINLHIPFWVSRDNIKRAGPLSYVDSDMYNGNPLLEYHIQLKRDMKINNLISFMSDLLCSEYYIYTHINLKGISTINDFSHDLLVYGLDFDNCKVLVVGYTQIPYGFYGKFQIDFELFTKAFLEEVLDNQDREFVYLKKNDVAPEFSHEKLMMMTNDYLNSKISLDKFMLYREDSSNCYDFKHSMSKYKFYKRIHTMNYNIYGLETYKYLCEYINYACSSRNPYYDLRTFRVIVEHKRVMMLRFQYLKNNGIYHQSNISEMLEKYDDMLKKSNIIFNIIKRKQILMELENKPDRECSELCKRIYEIRDLEEEILLRFLNSMDQNIY
jgi:hypothetical protein